MKLKYVIDFTDTLMPFDYLCYKLGKVVCECGVEATIKIFNPDTIKRVLYLEFDDPDDALKFKLRWIGEDNE